MPRWVPVPCPEVRGDMGDSAEPSLPCPEPPLPLTALLSLQKKEDKKVVNGKAAEQEDVPGMWPLPTACRTSRVPGVCGATTPSCSSPAPAMLLPGAVAEQGALLMSPGREKRTGPMPKEEELPETETLSAEMPGGPKGLAGEGLQPR